MSRLREGNEESPLAAERSWREKLLIDDERNKSWREDLERLKEATAKQSEAKDLLIEKQQQKVELLKKER